MHFKRELFDFRPLKLDYTEFDHNLGTDEIKNKVTQTLLISVESLQVECKQ